MKYSNKTLYAASTSAYAKQTSSWFLRPFAFCSCTSPVRSSVSCWCTGVNAIVVCPLSNSPHLTRTQLNFVISQHIYQLCDWIDRLIDWLITCGNRLDDERMHRTLCCKTRRIWQRLWRKRPCMRTLGLDLMPLWFWLIFLFELKLKWIVGNLLMEKKDWYWESVGSTRGEVFVFCLYTWQSCMWVCDELFSLLGRMVWLFFYFF